MFSISQSCTLPMDVVIGGVCIGGTLLYGIVVVVVLGSLLFIVRLILRFLKIEIIEVYRFIIGHLHYSFFNSLKRPKVNKWHSAADEEHRKQTRKTFIFIGLFDSGFPIIFSAPLASCNKKPPFLINLFKNLISNIFYAAIFFLDRKFRSLSFLNISVFFSSLNISKGGSIFL